MTRFTVSLGVSSDIAKLRRASARELRVAAFVVLANVLMLSKRESIMMANQSSVKRGSLCFASGKVPATVDTEAGTLCYNRLTVQGEVSLRGIDYRRDAVQCRRADAWPPTLCCVVFPAPPVEWYCSSS